MDGDDENAKLYRSRAEKLRAIAAAVHDSRSHKILLELADEYEHIAASCDAMASTDRKLAARNSK
jgi:hypothetical protein